MQSTLVIHVWYWSESACRPISLLLDHCYDNYARVTVNLFSAAGGSLAKLAYYSTVVKRRSLILENPKDVCQHLFVTSRGKIFSCQNFKCINIKVQSYMINTRGLISSICYLFFRLLVSSVLKLIVTRKVYFKHLKYARNIGNLHVFSLLVEVSSKLLFLQYLLSTQQWCVPDGTKLYPCGWSCLFSSLWWDCSSVYYCVREG